MGVICLKKQRLIDANKLCFSQRYARADPESDKLIPVLSVDKTDIESAETKKIKTECDLCEDYDTIANIVCYLPDDNGDGKTISIEYCPCCGRKIEI